MSSAARVRLRSGARLGRRLLCRPRAHRRLRSGVHPWPPPLFATFSASVELTLRTTTGDGRVCLTSTYIAPVCRRALPRRTPRTTSHDRASACLLRLPWLAHGCPLVAKAALDGCAVPTATDASLGSDEYLWRRRMTSLTIAGTALRITTVLPSRCAHRTGTSLMARPTAHAESMRSRSKANPFESNRRTRSGRYAACSAFAGALCCLSPVSPLAAIGPFAARPRRCPGEVSAPARFPTPGCWRETRCQTTPLRHLGI